MSKKPSAQDQFAIPFRLSAHLTNLGAPWFIAGGWALDLFLDQITRSHCDIEFLIFRDDQLELQHHLAGFALTKITAGTEQPWPPGELVEASLHQMRARSADFEFDIFLADTEADRWIYRRDLRVTRPRVTIGTISRAGLPVLAPELVLLFKAKCLLSKDQVDFERTAPALAADARCWLREALEIAHPGCPWIGSLEESFSANREYR